MMLSLSLLPFLDRIEVQRGLKKRSVAEVDADANARLEDTSLRGGERGRLSVAVDDRKPDGDGFMKAV